MISTIFEEELIKHEVTLPEFSELLIRLLDYGVIMRGESQIETMLYDRFLQCTEVVVEYLNLIKITILHDKQFCFVRAFPPGSIVPGLQSNDGDTAFNSGMRIKPSQQDIAVILVLRVEYEKSLREGSIDEKGCVLLSMEAISIALKNLLKRSLPENQGERKAIFRHLRQLRLIKFSNETDLDSEDSWISIQPSISSFVSSEVLSALYPDEGHAEGNTDVL